MNLENIYRVITVYNDREINLLIDNKWIILKIGNDIITDYQLNAQVQGQIQVMLGADKKTYNAFNLETYYKTHEPNGEIKYPKDKDVLRDW